MSQSATDLRWERGPALLDSVWKYRWLVLLLTILAAEGGYLYAARQPVVYSAAAQVTLTDPRNAGVFREERGGVWVEIQRYLDQQAALMGSSQVAERASDILNGRLSPGEIRRRVNAQPSTELNLVTVSASHGEPEMAADIANAVAQAYGEVSAENALKNSEAALEQLEATRTELQERIDTLEDGLREAPSDQSLESQRQAAIQQLVTVQSRADQIRVDATLYGSGVEFVEEARPPDAPASPRPERNAAIVGLLGLLAATAFALWRGERVDTANDPTAPGAVLGAPLLGEIPEFRTRREGLVPAGTAPYSASGESYQSVVAALDYVMHQHDARTVLVTSAEPGDGKTVTALNLAVAAQRDGRNVVVVDADQRRRGLTTLTGLDERPGLSDMVELRASLEGAIWATLKSAIWASDLPGCQHASVLPIGTAAPDDVSLVRSRGFPQTVARISEEADLVLFDAPPVLVAAEPLALSAHVDGIVFVVRRGTSMKTLAKAKARLEFAGKPVLGYVFNFGTGVHGKYSVYYQPVPPRGKGPVDRMRRSVSSVSRDSTEDQPPARTG